MLSNSLPRARSSLNEFHSMVWPALYTYRDGEMETACPLDLTGSGGWEEWVVITACLLPIGSQPEGVANEPTIVPKDHFF